MSGESSLASVYKIGRSRHDTIVSVSDTAGTKVYLC